MDSDEQSTDLPSNQKKKKKNLFSFLFKRNKTKNKDKANDESTDATTPGNGIDTKKKKSKKKSKEAVNDQPTNITATDIVMPAVAMAPAKTDTKKKKSKSKDKASINDQPTDITDTDIVTPTINLAPTNIDIDTTMRNSMIADKATVDYQQTDVAANNTVMSTSAIAPTNTDALTKRKSKDIAAVNEQSLQSTSTNSVTIAPTNNNSKKKKKKVKEKQHEDQPTENTATGTIQPTIVKPMTVTDTNNIVLNFVPVTKKTTRNEKSRKNSVISNNSSADITPAWKTKTDTTSSIVTPTANTHPRDISSNVASPTWKSVKAKLSSVVTPTTNTDTSDNSTTDVTPSWDTKNDTFSFVVLPTTKADTNDISVNHTFPSVVSPTTYSDTSDISATVVTPTWESVNDTFPSAVSPTRSIDASDISTTVVTPTLNSRDDTFPSVVSPTTDTSDNSTTVVTPTWESMKDHFPSVMSPKRHTDISDVSTTVVTPTLESMDISSVVSPTENIDTSDATPTWKTINADFRFVTPIVNTTKSHKPTDITFVVPTANTFEDSSSVGNSAKKTDGNDVTFAVPKWKTIKASSSFATQKSNNATSNIATSVGASQLGDDSDEEELSTVNQSVHSSDGDEESFNKQLISRPPTVQQPFVATTSKDHIKSSLDKVKEPKGRQHHSGAAVCVSHDKRDVWNGFAYSRSSSTSSGFDEISSPMTEFSYNTSDQLRSVNAVHSPIFDIAECDAPSPNTQQPTDVIVNGSSGVDNDREKFRNVEQCPTSVRRNKKDPTTANRHVNVASTTRSQTTPGDVTSMTSSGVSSSSADDSNLGISSETSAAFLKLREVSSRLNAAAQQSSSPAGASSQSTVPVIKTKTLTFNSAYRNLLSSSTHPPVLPVSPDPLPGKQQPAKWHQPSLPAMARTTALASTVLRQNSNRSTTDFFGQPSRRSRPQLSRSPSDGSSHSHCFSDAISTASSGQASNNDETDEYFSCASNTDISGDVCVGYDSNQWFYSSAVELGKPTTGMILDPRMKKAAQRRQQVSRSGIAHSDFNLDMRSRRPGRSVNGISQSSERLNAVHCGPPPNTHHAVSRMISAPPVSSQRILATGSTDSLNRRTSMSEYYAKITQSLDHWHQQLASNSSTSSQQDTHIQQSPVNMQDSVTPTSNNEETQFGYPEARTSRSSLERTQSLCVPQPTVDFERYATLDKSSVAPRYHWLLDRSHSNPDDDIPRTAMARLNADGTPKPILKK